MSTSTAEAATGFASGVAPVQQEVTVGLTNDTETEITSGIEEGQLVVSKTTIVSKTATAAKSSGNILSALGSGGPPGGMGGGARTTGATRTSGSTGR